MTSYQQNIVDIVSQAARHLLGAPVPVGTILYDQNGAVLFDNGTSRFEDDDAMIGAMVDCTVNPVPGALFQCDSPTATAFAMSLGGQYMFVMVGYHFENDAIERFLINLQQMLPANAFAHN